jgi:hypothetical protein
MTDVVRLFDLQFGLHSDVSDFSSTPGTVSRILPLRADGLMPRQRTPIDRPLIASDGRRQKRVHGARDIGPINIGMEFRGMSNASGGAVTVQSVMEQARMLDSFFGTAASAISGAATTATGGTPGSGTLTVTSGTNIANGDMVLFRTGSATGPVVMREVVSGGGTGTLTFDSAYTGTPFATGTVYRAARWNLSTSTTHHTHGYFRAEGESFRRDYYGCFCDSMTLTIPDSGPVAFDTVWMPTDYADVAEANPSYSAPTAGQPVVASACDFRIAGTAFFLRNAKITLSNGAIPRASVTGPNGVQGYVAGNKTNVMLEGEIYMGDGTSPSAGELRDGAGTPSLNSLLGDTDDLGDEVTSRDISLAVGGAENAAFYVRIPAADIRGSVADSGGLAVYRFQAYATAPSSGSAFRLGVF